MFRSDGTLVLQKINTRDRPFKRFISQLWVPPLSTHDAVAHVDIPLAPCLCPEPEPPRLLPEICDSTTQVDVPSTTNDLDKWCSLMTDYSSVDRLQQAFDEAGVEAHTFFDLIIIPTWQRYGKGLRKQPPLYKHRSRLSRWTTSTFFHLSPI